MADGSLVFDTQMDTAGFYAGIANIKRQAASVTSIFRKMGLAIGAAFTVKEIVELGNEAIGLASDLQEVQNVVDTAFDSMSYKMEEFAETCIETYGISKLTAKEMGSTFMAMGKGMGQATDVASDMAVELTGRLGDMMSFYNKTASEAQTIGKAIYSGETEPLKQIGIIMTETNLEAYALAKGYKKLYSEMEAKEKLFVRQQYFLEQTDMAAGDFLKTQDSWANQTRILSERWKEFLTISGAGLIEVFTPMVGTLNDMVLALTEATKAMYEFLGIQTDTASSAGNLADYENEVNEEIKTASKSAKKAIAPFDELILLQTDATTGSADTSVSTVPDISDTISDTVEATQNTEAVDTFIEKFTGVKELFEDIKELVSAVKLGDMFEVGKETGEIVTDIVNLLTDAIGAVDWDALGEKVGEFLNGIDWDSVFKETGELIAEALYAAIDFSLSAVGAATAQDRAKLVVAALAGMQITGITFPGLFESVKQTILGIFSGGITMPQLLLTISSVFPSFVGTPFGDVAGNMLIDSLDAFITEHFGEEVLSACGDALFVALGAGIGTVLGGPIGALVGATVALIIEAFDEESYPGQIWASIRDNLFNFDMAAGFFDKAKEDFKAAAEGEGIKEIGGHIVSGILNGFNAFITGLGEPFVDLFDWVVGGICDVFGISDGRTSAAETEPIGESIAAGISKGFNSEFDQFRVLAPIRASSALNDLKTKVKVKMAEFGPLVSATFKDMGDKFEEFKKDSKEKVSEWIKSVKKTLSDKAEEIEKNWSTSWTDIKKTAVDLLNQMKEEIKTPINGILGFIESMVNGIIAGVNMAIDALNELSFTIPDWVPGNLGGQTFGFDISHVRKVSIPKLATGTVVPANYGEFAAILGDNKRETEVVSPLSTMKQALKEAILEVGGIGGGDIHITFEAEGETLHRVVVKQDRRYRKQTGKSAFAQ